MSRILLANTQPTSRSVMSKVLSQAGYEVVLAEDRKETVEHSNTGSIDLVIADMQILKREAPAVASEIRRGKPDVYLPIIFLSHNKDSRVKALEAGGDDCLTKPVDGEELLAKVKAQLRAKRLYDELFQAKEAFRKSEEKYRVLVETTDTGFAILDQECRVLDANCEYVRLSGHLELKNIIGSSVLEWTAEHHKIRMADELMACEKKGYVRNLEIDLQNRAGHITPIEINASVLITEQGQRIMSICRDISKRKHTERALAERAILGALGADIGLALTEGESLKKMLQRCCELLVEHLDAAFARIWTLDKEEDLLRLRGSAGLYTHLNGAHSRLSVGQCVVGRVAEDRRPHTIKCVVAEQGLRDKEWVKREGMVAFAGHPLIVEDRLVGVMGLFMRKALSDITEKALASVARKIALGIERKRSEEALLGSENTFRRIFEHAVDGIYIVGLKDKRTRACNKTMCHMLGYGPEEMKELSLIHLHPEEELPRVLEQLAKMSTREIPRMRDVAVRRKDGTIFYADIDASAMTWGGVKCLMGIFRDVTERRKIQEKLRSTSMTDELTGLLNRRGFFTLAHKQWKMAERNQKGFSLLYFDLDGLKYINDHYGHQSGDTALMDTAKILKESFRESDIIARIGGDEFVVLITDPPHDNVMDLLADHLEDKLKKHNRDGGRCYELSISQGAENYDPRFPCSIDELLTRADARMYEQKKNKVRKRERES